MTPGTVFAPVHNSELPIFGNLGGIFFVSICYFFGISFRLDYYDTAANSSPPSIIATGKDMDTSQSRKAFKLVYNFGGNPDALFFLSGRVTGAVSPVDNSFRITKSVWAATKFFCLSGAL
jgi:hypothetical protein